MLFKADNEIPMRFVMQSLRSPHQSLAVVYRSISNKFEYNLDTATSLFLTNTQCLSPSVYNGSALPSVQRFLSTEPCRARNVPSSFDAHTTKNRRRPCQHNADVLDDTESIRKKRALTRRRYAPKKPRTRWRSVKALRLQMH